jgi:hypothetical protein
MTFKLGSITTVFILIALDTIEAMKKYLGRERGSRSSVQKEMFMTIHLAPLTQLDLLR